MDAINYETELRHAGANSTQGWRKFTFIAQRHLLGTIGLVIMVMFVLAAALADVICRVSPLAGMSGAGSSTARAYRWPSALVRPR